MSQMGGPSEFSGAPEITAAKVKIAFVPDQESLDRVLQDAERQAKDVIDRLVLYAKAAILDVANAHAAETLRAGERPADTRQRVELESDTQPQSGRAVPVTDQLLLAVARIGVDVTEIKESAEQIVANTAPQ